MVAGGGGRAVVIGGGVAGLSAAAELSGSGWRVLVLEKEAEVGGRCRTARSGDFLFDTGAQHFHDSFDDTLNAAIRNGLGDKFRLPRQTKGIFHEGSLSEFVPRDLNPASLLPWKAMGRTGILDAAFVGASLLRGYNGYNLRFPFWWQKGDNRLAEDYLAKRTTRRYRQVVAEPVALYAHGAGLDDISESAYLVAQRYTFGDRTGGFTEGMGSLPAALARKAEVVTGMEATGIVREGGSVVGVTARPTKGGRSRKYKADLVVCAVPAPLVAGVTGELGPAASRIVGETSYAPAIVVNMAFDGQPQGPGGPVLLPSIDGFRASWICAGNSKADEYAPAGTTVISEVFAAQSAESLLETSDDVLIAMAQADSARVIGTDRANCLAARVDRHRMARPVVSPGHASRVQALRVEGSGVEGLVLAGDWTMSPTVEGAVSSGRWAASFALAHAAASQ